MVLALNALEPVYNANIAHVTNGGAITDGNFSVAGDIANGIPNTDGYSWIQAILAYARAAAGTADLNVAFYRRLLNMDGVAANDEPIPQATWQHKLVGMKPSHNVTGTQYIQVNGIFIPANCEAEIYIRNETGQTINAGWTLDIRLWTWRPNPA